MCIVTILTTNQGGVFCKAVSAREAKHHFDRLIEEARVEPVVVGRDGYAVVVVLVVEEYQRLPGRTMAPPAKKREDEQ